MLMNFHNSVTVRKANPAFYNKFCAETARLPKSAAKIQKIMK